MGSGIHRRRFALVAGALLCASQAEAGLSLEQAVERHRALANYGDGRSADLALLAAPRDGVTLAIGGPDEDTPYLLAPTLRGRGGARAVITPLDQPGKPRLRLGLAWHEDVPPEGVLEGSSLDLPVGAGVLYASVETRHWGPGWVGSLILDAAAPPLPAIGWRKTSAMSFQHPWLAWLGPWNADMFIGRLGGHAEPARPWLIGMRAQVRPLPGLEIGVSRAIQWGGAGRDQSLRSFLSALVGRDNVEDGDRSSEPGNQLAGLDVRYSSRLPDGEWALYGQAIGEDEAGLLPSKLIAQAGAEWATRWHSADVRLFIEGSDLLAGDTFGGPHPGVTYRHHIYRQGYTVRGLPLGHPLGGDAKLASLGALVDRGPVSLLVTAHRGRASAQAQRFAPHAALTGLNAGASMDLAEAGRIGLSLWHWRAGADRSSAVQAWWQTAWR